MAAVSNLVVVYNIDLDICHGNELVKFVEFVKAFEISGIISKGEDSTPHVFSANGQQLQRRASILKIETDKE